MNWRTRRLIGGASLICVATLPLAWFGTNIWSRQAAVIELSERRGVLDEKRDHSLGVDPLAQADPETGEVSQLEVELSLEPDVAEFLTLLEELAEVSDVFLEDLDAKKSSSAGRQSYALIGKGTATDICALLADIEAYRRLIMVETARLAAQPDGLVRIEIGLASFHRIEN